MKTIRGHKLKPETAERLRAEAVQQKRSNSERIIRELRAKIASPPANYGKADIDAESEALAELENNFVKKYGEPCR